jgi:hypothetical protein
MARVIAGLALFLALVGAGFLIFAETYSGQSCSNGADDVYRCVDTSATLIEMNGNWVLALLGLPIALAAAQHLLVANGAPGLITGVIAAAFLGFCLVAIFSIGIFFLPSAVAALLAATVRHNRTDPQRA